VQISLQDPARPGPEIEAVIAQNDADGGVAILGVPNEELGEERVPGVSRAIWGSVNIDRTVASSTSPRAGRDVQWRNVILHAIDRALIRQLIRMSRVSCVSKVCTPLSPT
jgi:hypothetical protein